MPVVTVTRFPQGCGAVTCPPSMTCALKAHSPGTVLVQPELERGRSPLVSVPPCGRGFQGIRVYRSDVVSLKSAEARPPGSVHRLDEPTGLSLSMVASPQCRFRFARQNHCSAAATRAANFWILPLSGGVIRTTSSRWGSPLASPRVVGLHFVRPRDTPMESRVNRRYCYSQPEV